MNCWAAHSYWPLCALNPWEMTTTACGLPAGCHSRVKILMPSTPLKLPSVMVESPHPDGASIAMPRSVNAASPEPGWSDNAAVASSRKSRGAGPSYNARRAREYPRKFVDADDPSSTLTILRRRLAEPTPFGRAPLTPSAAARGEVGWRVPCLLSQREQAMKIVVIGGKPGT